MAPARRLRSISRASGSRSQIGSGPVIPGFAAVRGAQCLIKRKIIQPAGMLAERIFSAPCDHRHWPCAGSRYRPPARRTLRCAVQIAGFIQPGVIQPASVNQRLQTDQAVITGMNRQALVGRQIFVGRPQRQRLPDAHTAVSQEIDKR